VSRRLKLRKTITAIFDRKEEDNSSEEQFALAA